MALEQRALLIRVDGTGTDGLSELNVQLQRGWRVAHVTPLGGTGLDEAGTPATSFLAALVVIERHTDAEGAVAVEALKQTEPVEEEPEEVVEEVVEENGAGPPISGS